MLFNFYLNIIKVFLYWCMAMTICTNKANKIRDIVYLVAGNTKGLLTGCSVIATGKPKLKTIVMFMIFLF